MRRVLDEQRHGGDDARDGEHGEDLVEAELAALQFGDEEGRSNSADGWAR